MQQQRHCWPLISSFCFIASSSNVMALHCHELHCHTGALHSDDNPQKRYYAKRVSPSEQHSSHQQVSACGMQVWGRLCCGSMPQGSPLLVICPTSHSHPQVTHSMLQYVAYLHAEGRRWVRAYGHVAVCDSLWANYSVGCRNRSAWPGQTRQHYQTCCA